MFNLNWLFLYQPNSILLMNQFQILYSVHSVSLFLFHSINLFTMQKHTKMEINRNVTIINQNQSININIHVYLLFVHLPLLSLTVWYFECVRKKNGMKIANLLKPPSNRKVQSRMIDTMILLSSCREKTLPLIYAYLRIIDMQRDE